MAAVLSLFCALTAMSLEQLLAEQNLSVDTLKCVFCSQFLPVLVSSSTTLHTIPALPESL